ncbi:MAG TPA: alpha/beta fold hydrolase [Actinobacteria bacterium]|nr:alpha/beta fold hydrolase [Actinomycetota bacterium]
MSDYFDPLVAPFTWRGTIGESVVMVHGFTGTAAHFRLLGRFLNDRQYTTIAPLLAGHGTSMAEMAQTDNDDWLASVRVTTESALAENDRVHLVGLSLGGLLSVLIADELPVTSVTTINAPIRFKNARTYASPLLSRITPMISWPEAPPPPLADEAKPLWLTYSGFPTKALADLVTTSRMALEAASRVRIASLTIQSKADATVKPISGRLLADALGPRNRLVWLERSIQNSLLDGERDIIHHAVLDRIRSA